MKLSLRVPRLANQSLKIISLILGYFFWLTIAQTQNIDIKMDIPLCFYNTPANLDIAAPELIKINLFGKRLDLYNLDFTQLAAHIDAKNITKGDNEVKLSENEIFLHNKIKLVNYIPSTIIVQAKDKTNINKA
jgi:hypothetical protein